MSEDKDLTASQKYYLRNREHIIQYNKEYYKANLFDKKVYNILYYHKHKDELREKHRIWRNKNKLHVNKKQREEYYPRYIAKLCGDKTVQETLQEINKRKEEKQKKLEEPIQKRLEERSLPSVLFLREEVVVSFD